jgi:hypothetical protein
VIYGLILIGALMAAESSLHESYLDAFASRTPIRSCSAGVSSATNG